MTHSRRAQVREAWRHGVIAAANNVSIDENPHALKCKEWHSWRRGYWSFRKLQKRKSDASRLS